MLQALDLLGAPMRTLMAFQSSRRCTTGTRSHRHRRFIVGTVAPLFLLRMHGVRLRRPGTSTHWQSLAARTSAFISPGPCPHGSRVGVHAPAGALDKGIAKRHAATLKQESTHSPATKEDVPGTGMLPAWVWKFLMLAVCMIQATNFAVIKNITAQPNVTSELYAVSRFTVAALAMAPFLVSISSTEVLLQALQCGAWVAFGFAGQAIGLMSTTAAKSCFICSLNVVFVALVLGISSGKRDPRTLLAALIAVAGVGVLELAGSQQFVIGDLYSLAQPIGFGIGYIQLEQIMAKNPDDALGVTAVKVIMTAIGSWGFFAFSGGSFPDFGPVLAAQPALQGVLWCGLGTTAVSLVLESVAFRYVDAASASVIFTTQPLWAALFAVWLIGEPLTAADCIGGFMVLSACLLKEAPQSMLPWSSSSGGGGSSSS